MNYYWTVESHIQKNYFQKIVENHKNHLQSYYQMTVESHIQTNYFQMIGNHKKNQIVEKSQRTHMNFRTVETRNHRYRTSHCQRIGTSHHKNYCH
jgi:hypothetical protein